MATLSTTADLRAENLLVIAQGAPDNIVRARELLGQTTHDPLDHHQATATVSHDIKTAT